MPVPKTAEKPERKTLREVAKERIRDAILDGTLTPGERLNDDQLMEWLGVSRTPLREALNELALVGLVETAAQKYTRVAVANEDHVVYYLQTLGALIGGVVRVTVPTLGATGQKRLAAEIEAVLKATRAEDATEFNVVSWNLVRVVLDLCENPVLVRATADTLDSVLYRATHSSASSSLDWDMITRRYEALAEAIAEKDAIKAELAIELLFRLPDGDAD
ncbi:GntR family transcriptional regulator [Microbacterium oxydans]|uniref:GntR family transcriptional regulator n=1 Tax=Microbacterium oxydans TaxID=82380 RepID=UPI00226B42F0|nr:GntR family transcriptional regulator [Microbacterium oxydans]WAA65633.1 GntR family transcriptional regulator [Microbacterium oxydans]